MSVRCFIGSVTWKRWANSKVSLLFRTTAISPLHHNTKYIDKISQICIFILLKLTRDVCWFFLVLFLLFACWYDYEKSDNDYLLQQPYRYWRSSLVSIKWWLKFFFTDVLTTNLFLVKKLLRNNLCFCHKCFNLFVSTSVYFYRVTLRIINLLIKKCSSFLEKYFKHTGIQIYV